MKLELPAKLYSSQGLALVIDELKSFASWRDHEQLKYHVSSAAPDRVSPPELSEAAKQLLANASNGQPLTASVLAELVANLTDLSTNAPTVHITLAAMPSDGLKTTLVEWVRREINPSALVTFRFSSNLLGGMVVRVGSRILDWSFRRQILANRHQFAEVLRHV